MTRKFALVYGLVFLAIGLLGVAQFGFREEPSLLLGIFPINGMHSAVHLLIGAAGILAFYMRGNAPRNYARVAGSVYLAAALVGLVSPSGFGMMPIGGADIVLHLLAGSIAFYLGFRMPRGREPWSSIPFEPPAPLPLRRAGTGGHTWDKPEGHL